MPHAEAAPAALESGDCFLLIFFAAWVQLIEGV
jgi:hypothetical protein